MQIDFYTFFIIDIDILNGLEWTKGLDDVFQKNYKNDSEIMWQYFGSQTGFMRTYPGEPSTYTFKSMI